MQNINYSDRNDFTGLSTAALNACIPTIPIAMMKANPPANGKVHHGMEIRMG